MLELPYPMTYLTYLLWPPYSLHNFTRQSLSVVMKQINGTTQIIIIRGEAIEQ